MVVKLIKRYTRKEMGDIWSEKNKFTNWARVEIYVLEARVEIGELDIVIPPKLIETIKIDPDEIARLEESGGKHDVIAFLQHTSTQLPEYIRPWWHHKMTSYDPQDTGLSLQLVASVDLLIASTLELMTAVKSKAIEYKHTAMIGRSHAVHGEPITFGVKLANWYDELQRNLARLRRLRELVAVGKISGAMGIFTLDPRVEEIVCDKLGLKPITTTQIIARDIHADYITQLAIIGGTLAKIAVNGRLLQQTEVLEAQEFFSKGQKGSSAMPHKRNPIGLENNTGLARLLHGYAVTAMENQNTWYERDIANSGPERVILPDASIVLHYMITRLTKIIEKWIIYPRRMRQNLNITKGLVFSQDVQALVAEKSNLPREEAYSLVQAIAQSCWDTRADFHKALLNDDEIMKYVTVEELQECFNLQNKLKYVDYIFERVFGQE